MAISAGIAAVASVATAYNGYKSGQQQKAAGREAVKNAQATADAADQANNKANQKRPDSTALLAGNAATAAGGNAGTMLTGAGGIDLSQLQLGKSTLLGGGGG